MNFFGGVLFKRVLLTAFIPVVLFGLSACGEPVEKMLLEEESNITEVTPVSDGKVADIITRAQATHDKAMSLSHGWTRTQPLIDKANTALQEGNEEAAREMAQRALFMAQASVQQAKTEATAWKERVPK